MNVCHLHARNGVVGEGVRFERIRRVTGYLVGSLSRFNNAKRAEVNDRVKHMRLGAPATASVPMLLPAPAA